MNEVHSLSNKYLQEYLEVSRCWRGFGHLTIQQGLRKLHPISRQRTHLLLALRARSLIDEIVSGKVASAPTELPISKAEG